MIFSPKNAPETVSAPGLQVREDISFFKKEVLVQRVGWGMVFAVLVLGALGLFGTGKLSYKQLHSGEIEFSYEKFLRCENETHFVFRLSDAPVQTYITFPQNYQTQFQIERIMPQPEYAAVRDGRMIFCCNTQGKAEINMAIIPKKAGRVHTRLTINQSAFSFSQFVYP